MQNAVYGDLGGVGRIRAACNDMGTWRSQSENGACVTGRTRARNQQLPEIRKCTNKQKLRKKKNVLVPYRMLIPRIELPRALEREDFFDFDVDANTFQNRSVSSAAAEQTVLPSGLIAM